MSSLFFTTHAAPAPSVRLVPRGLCGIDGCVFLKGHKVDHSWNRPFARTTSSDASTTTPTKFGKE